MLALNVRFSRVSLSGALLVLSAAPMVVQAASCDGLPCLTSPQSNLLVDNGSTVLAGTGATLTDSIVSLGTLQLLDESVASSTTIKDSGWLEARDSAKLTDTLMENGTLVLIGSATALTTRVNDGFFEVTQNAAVSDTRLDGGQMYVYGDALAKNTLVANSLMTVYQNGHAQQTTVNAGGELAVNDTASVDDTRINQGGTMTSVAGTTVSNTTVNQGGVMVLGAAATASDTTLNDGALLRLKGDAALNGANRLDGRVEFADPAISGAFHTLTINGPLTGNGTFAMNTDLASLRGDLLKVQGTISDLHTLVVADSGNAPSGAQQALKLVEGNGGNGDFQLFGGTVDAGAYRYSLQKQGNDWYLGKPAISTPDESIQEPQVPPVDGQPETAVQPVVIQPPATPQPQPQPQSQILSKGANAAVANQAATAALLDAQNGSTRQHFSDLRSGKDQGGIWARGYGTEQKLDTRTSRAFQQQANGMEIGADTALPTASGTLYVGALFGQGQGRQDFGERSKGTIDSTTLGAYASYQDQSGLYVDGALKYSRLNNEIKITSNLGDPVKAHYDNHAVSAEAQIGKVIDLGRDWFVEPQVSVQVTRISGGRYTASNGLDVQQDAMTSVQSRVGAQFGRELQLDKGLRIKPYVKAAWVTEHAGDSEVKVNGARLDSRLPGSRAELGGGLMLTAAQNHHVYVEGQYAKGSDIEQPWAVNVGYRYNW
ncbi:MULTISPECIES: autotransporter outer membrane beta-barrel domain-containing protein [Pseudomonas]|uniref:Autotransporter outer membrane beta-barrel domain-containing protein n=1 Tax=Pseudomonas kribbensis TaxID=1628086 RepID=A0A4Y8VER2_9PSED|nr:MULTISPECIES: autotransporter outer membrane beta-barrel domain-containing protein [Pseudomonas]TFH79210.1 autotransporter outer membrane beta-barrel domain-containing protein [Pseudomonas kribbensis]